MDAIPDGGQDTGRDALTTVAGAAERLGISKEAVRKRIARGTLRSDKDQYGTVLVYIPSSGTSSGTTDHATDRSELVEELRDRVAYLERQVEEERESRRRADTIIAQLSAANAEQARTIRAIEAPTEAPEAPETVEEEPERVEPRPAAPEPQTAPQRRSLWRRVFGR